MKKKTLLVASLGILALSQLSNGAVTISFDAPFIGGLSSNFANSAGVVTNGMTWGIIVSSSNNTFGSSYDALATGTALTTSTVATDDFFFLGGVTVDSTQGGGLEEGTGPGGGNGGLGTFNFDLGGTVTAGDLFRVVWLDGANGGYLSDASFVVPVDGIYTIDAPFVGEDPIRRAGLAYEGTSGTSTGPGFTIVPEPSAALLGAVGALGLLRRRRI